MLEHLDESGQTCTHHPAAAPDQILALAAVGSRMPGFHHDAASKLQSLMMSLDEIGELAETGTPELRQVADTANTALRELHQLFTMNRALAKPPQRKRTGLPELVARAAERCGVKLRGEIAAIEVDVAPPSITHALSLLLDLAGGPAQLGRVVEVVVVVTDRVAALTLAGPSGAALKPSSNAGESLALAAFLLAREDGELRCSSDGERFLIKLPVAMASTEIPTL